MWAGLPVGGWRTRPSSRKAMVFKRIFSVSALLAMCFFCCGFSGGFLGCFGSHTLLSMHVQDTQYRDGILVGAQPRPAQQVSGLWNYDLTSPTGSVKSFGFDPYVFTDMSGRYDVTNARLNANWTLQGQFNPPCYQTYPTETVVYQLTVSADVTTAHHDASFECATETEDAAYVSPGFLLSTAMPSAITVQASAQPVSTGSGSPTLYVYNRTGDTATTLTASSFTSANATFPATALKSLAADMYGVAMVNVGSSAGLNFLGHGWMSIGQDDQTYPAAFGVDAIHFAEAGTICYSLTGPKSSRCSSVNTVLNYPIATLYNAGQIKANGGTTAVGTHPTVIRVYNVKTTTRTDSFGGVLHITEPQNALVVNTGSNSVSIINLAAGTVTATIAVGSQPVDARISADNSTAYVVNYESGTISKINLSTNTVSATANIGSNPTALDLNASGSPVVGGNGYIVTLNPSSLAVQSTQQVSGSVIALAVSQAQNQVVTSTTSGSGTGQTAALATRSIPTNAQLLSSNSGTTQPYLQSSISSSLAYPSQLGTGILVSPVLNNSLAAVATPTGFVITDLETNAIMLTGTTPHAVRGMAIDVTNGYFYFTMPDSNSVVTVPIPTTPLDDSVQFLN